MKHVILALGLIIPSSNSLIAQERHLMLMLSTPGIPWVLSPSTTNEVTIGDNEVAQVVSYKMDATAGTGAQFVKPFGGSNFVDSFGYGDVIPGPATLRLYFENRTGTTAAPRGRATFKITPVAFPPDKTFIIPDGTPGATVTLETSTNLLTWTTATNGFYTGTNGAKFFRINAQRTP